MRKIIMSIFMAFIIFCNSTLLAYASSNSDGTPMTGFRRWFLHGVNDFYHVCENFGVIFNSNLWGSGSLHDNFINHLSEGFLIEDSETVEDYLNAHITITTDENGNDVAHYDNQIVNAIYDFAIDTIEEEAGFMVTKSADSKTFFKEYIQNFTTYSQYSALLEYIEQNPNYVFWFADKLNFSNRANPDDVSIIYKNAISFYVIEIDNTDLIGSYYAYAKSYYISPYDKNWQSCKLRQYCIDDSGELHSLTESALSVAMFLQGKDFYNPFYRYYSYQTPPVVDGITNIIINPTSTGFFVSHGEKEIRIYKSLDCLKQYSVGQRPYYITDKFQDYDINGDNSCIVTESDLSNGSVYGDVYNYIINNYDNPDGLTEDELRDILNDYFGEGSGGSGFGSGSEGSGSGSSGGGLSGFLSGLGSLGDALLGILGKLIEYIGKAIDLIVNGLTDIIDKIPKGVTDFMAAMFPFMPEEFFTALTLAMVLGVVCIVIKIFK